MTEDKLVPIGVREEFGEEGVTEFESMMKERGFSETYDEWKADPCTAGMLRNQVKERLEAKRER